MRRIAADLHVHTALSPCAESEMTPPAIVRRALERGLGMIAICDHNSCDNAAAVRRAAGGRLAVVPGIEITTAEEAHVLGLLPDPAAAGAVGAAVARSIGERPHEFLAAATGLVLAEAVDLIHERGGLAVAAHVDRPSFSVLSQLGVWPQDARFDAAELSAAGLHAGRGDEAAPGGLPVVASSDAHFLSEVGRCFTVLEMAEATFEELSLALRRPMERRCRDA
jgi:PHP family Zn ribbon phosphoesterase